VQTAAAIVCGAGQKYGVYYSCTAAVNTVVALSDTIIPLCLAVLEGLPTVLTINC
jgi:hypothetical protein